MAICARCIHLHGEAKRMHWRSWLCVQAPIETGTNPVTGESTEPYKACWKLNDGDCEMFEEGPNVLSPKETDK